MQCLYVVVLAGCVAMVASTVLRAPGGNAELENSQQSFGKVRGGGVGSQSRLNQDASGVDKRFQGSKAQGGVLQYNAKSDFESLINPRNEQADWRWAATSENKDVVFSHGAFLRDAKNTVDLVSLPFGYFTPQDETLVPTVVNQHEAVVVHKQNITVNKGKQLLVNVKFACKTFNAEDAPLPKEVVSTPEDDPTLANCGFGIASNDKSALVFSIVASNNGIWAVYERNRFEVLSHPERNQLEFNFVHRLANRQSPYDMIDASIKYDRDQNRVDYIIDGQVVYSLTKLGTLNDAVDSNTGRPDGESSPLDAQYKDLYTLDRPDLVRVEPKEFQVIIGVGSYPDTADPHSPSNPPLRGSKLTTNPNFYDPKAKFFDEQAMKEYIYWGQGASLTLKNVQIKLQSSGEDDTTNGGKNKNNRIARVVGQDEETEGNVE